MIQAAVNALTNANIDAAAAVAVSKLAAGTNGYVLTTTGGVPVWASPVAATTIYRKTTAKTVNTTTAATDLLNGEITIAAGVMGTTGLVRLTATIETLQNTGSILDAFRFQLIFGGTTLLDTGAGVAAQSTQSTASRFAAKITATIANLGVANSQWATIEGDVSQTCNSSVNTTFTTGEGRYIGIAAFPVHFFGGNTGALDTATSKLLELKVINPSSSVNCETKLYGAVVEIV